MKVLIILSYYSLVRFMFFVEALVQIRHRQVKIVVPKSTSFVNSIPFELQICLKFYKVKSLLIISSK